MRRWLLFFMLMILVGCGETVVPTAVPTQTPVPFTSTQIIEYFKSKGLEVGLTYTMKPEHYKVDMNGHEGTGFQIPSLCSGCGGQVIVVNDAKSFQALRDYYVQLGKNSTLLFSWVYTKDNVILQINGDLDKASATKYGDALGSIPGTETASSLMMEKPTPRPTNTPKPTARPTSTPKPTVVFEGYENPIPSAFGIPIIGEPYEFGSDSATDAFLKELTTVVKSEIIGRQVTKSKDDVKSILISYQVELDKLGWIKSSDSSDAESGLVFYRKSFSGEPLSLILQAVDRKKAVKIDDRLIIITISKDLNIPEIKIPSSSVVYDKSIKNINSFIDDLNKDMDSRLDNIIAREYYLVTDSIADVDSFYRLAYPDASIQAKEIEEDNTSHVMIIDLLWGGELFQIQITYIKLDFMGRSDALLGVSISKVN